MNCPSALSAVECGIASFEFNAGISGGELPVDFAFARVAFLFPCDDFGRQEFFGIDAAIKALPRQNA